MDGFAAFIAQESRISRNSKIYRVSRWWMHDEKKTKKYFVISKKSRNIVLENDAFCINFKLHA